MSPRVAILLCTYNAGPFLVDQLDSLAAQSLDTWQLWVSDDGSNDDTLAVLQQYQAQWGTDKLVVVSGPARGPAANFMSLVHDARIEADYFAYCDQDDIWVVDKLERAIRALQAVDTESDASMPLLYGSRTCYVDEDNTVLGLSPLFARQPAFANALVQNIAGGNTMVYNRPACALLRQVPASQPVVMHDWWTYLAVTACGGRMVYDPEPSVRYRQHPHNHIGQNTGLKARMQRLRGLLDGQFRTWGHINNAALEHLRPYMTADTLRQFDHFIQARNGNIVNRISSLYRSGVYRQRILDNVSLLAMGIVNRL